MKILRNSFLITTLFVCLLATNTINLSTQTEESFKENMDINLILYDTPKTSSPVNWTILVYLDADNNLESVGVDDFLEMSSIGEDQNVNILVQFDRHPYDAEDDDGYSDAYGDWDGTLRFNVTQGLEPYDYNAVQVLPEVNMGDSASLEDFISWGLDNSTTEHYALILWNHGSGWIDVCIDETTFDDGLELWEVENALSNVGKKFDIIAFDACLMGMAEVFYQIKDWCDFCVASEESIPGPGYPYHTILSDLKYNPTMSAKQLGEVIVNRYIQSYSTSDENIETISLVNMTKIDNLTNSINDLSYALINGVNKYRCDIQLARELSQIYSYDFYIDLYDFANGLYNYILNDTIKNAAQNVISNITAMVLSEEHNAAASDSHGISIFFPYELDAYNYFESDYLNLNFGSDLLWDEFLDAYHTTAIIDDNYEENDDFPEAYNLTAYEGVWLSFINGSGYMLQEEFDYYVIEISAGNNTLIVDLRSAWYYGDIDVYVYDSDYFEVANSESSDDNEYIECKVSPGIYYIEIFNCYLENSTYNMRWNQSYKVWPNNGNDDDDDDDDWANVISGFNVEFFLSFMFISILTISIMLLKRFKLR